MQTLLLAALTAFAVIILAGPIAIPLLRQLKFGQVEREEGPQSHKSKQGTPTMGGILILVGLLAATLIFSSEAVEFVIPTLLVVTAFALVGFLDDFIKVKLKRNLGLRAYQKIIAQFGIAFLIAYWAYRSPLIGSTVYLPISGGSVDFGPYYIPFVMFVIIAEVNAVNLTDGLDGLATGCTVTTALAYGVLAYLAHRFYIATEYLVIPHNPYLGELFIFMFALAGAGFGFLWFNCHPAKVFMGDTGSLAIGGALATAAVCTKQELMFVIIGGVFVMEAMSVVLQVGSFKLRRKRIFRMSPIHHHFELLGWHENQVINRFWIISIMLAIFGLTLLKIV